MPNRAGANGAVIVPGNSEESEVYFRISAGDAKLQMPPAGRLTPEQINIIKTWIDQGAEWPDELAGETPRGQPDPQAARIMEALRNGNLPAVRRVVHEDASGVNRHGVNGSTPLQYAALYGDLESVRLLLELGADPNLANFEHATALMYAVDDVEKTRVLLEKRADPNARSDEGLTPLLIAVTRAGSSAVVKLLLDHGADVAARYSIGTSPLGRAAMTGDPELVRLLLDRGAGKKPLALGSALRAGCLPCVDMLLPFAEPNDLGAALGTAAELGYAEKVAMLLNRGAGARGEILADVVLSPEAVPINVVKTLIERGADVSAKVQGAGTILDLAKLQGETPLVGLLVASGAKAGPATDAGVRRVKPAGSVRSAVERSIPLLQRADVAFLKRAGCVSCHNNSLTAMTLEAARQKRVAVDEAAARAQIQGTAAYLDANRERALQGVGIPGLWDTAGFILLGMAEAQYPADEITDAWARYLKNTQLPDGHWFTLGRRPPLEASSIEATAAAMRTLQVYGPQSKRPEYAQAVRRAAKWLESAQPRNTEDLTFQLLGLHWAGGNREAIRKAAKLLLTGQRPDGGWAQTSTLSSDAYATGEALAALRRAGVLQAESSAYQRGVRFLLNSQLEDGSWYVQSRARPFQPPFDSDFPHGRDQFISAAATNWAAMALLPCVR